MRPNGSTGGLHQLERVCVDLGPWPFSPLVSIDLETPATGTYGGLLATFNHLILAEAGYLRSPAGSLPNWAANQDESRDLEELVSRVEELAQIWEQSLSEPVDAERVLLVDDGAYEVRDGVILVQALHHGNAHREQICTILTTLGLEPPDIQAWEYAWATGRIWERKTCGVRVWPPEAAL